MRFCRNLGSKPLQCETENIVRTSGMAGKSDLFYIPRSLFSNDLSSSVYLCRH